MDYATSQRIIASIRRAKQGFFKGVTIVKTPTGMGKTGINFYVDGSRVDLPKAIKIINDYETYGS